MNHEKIKKREKDLELYKAAAANAFSNDTEKTFLNLSTAGIGFFIYLIAINSNMFFNGFNKFLVLISILSAFICMLSILLIFYFKKQQVISIIISPENFVLNKLLAKLNIIKYISFVGYLSFAVFYLITLLIF
jgi:hypothetical protein